MKGNRKKVTEKRQQLAENKEKLFTVEEKWIKVKLIKILMTDGIQPIVELFLI